MYEAEELTPKLEGTRIVKITDDEKPVKHEGEYNAYQVCIYTDKGVLRITGCHDGGPNLSFEPRKPLSPVKME